MPFGGRSVAAEGGGDARTWRTVGQKLSQSLGVSCGVARQGTRDQLRRLGSARTSARVTVRGVVSNSSSLRIYSGPGARPPARSAGQRVQPGCVLRRRGADRPGPAGQGWRTSWNVTAPGTHEMPAPVPRDESIRTRQDPQGPPPRGGPCASPDMPSSPRAAVIRSLPRQRIPPPAAPRSPAAPP